MPYENLEVALWGLAQILFVSILIEQILNFIFDHRLLRNRLSGKGLKPAISVIFSLSICFGLKLDVLNILFLTTKVHFLGIILTSLFVSGGSSRVYVLFESVLGISQRLRREKRAVEQLRLESEKARLEADLSLKQQEAQTRARPYWRRPRFAFTSDRPLARNSTGADVEALQTILTKTGYLRSPIRSGEFCEATANAVRSYQTFYSLKVDGIVGSQTKSLLEAVRCSIADRQIAPKLMGATMPCRVEKKKLSYVILNHAPGIAPSRCEVIVRECFDEWSSASGLQFHEVSMEDNPDFRLSWATGDNTSGIEFDGPGNTLAFAGAPVPCSESYMAGRAIFDSGERWIDDSSPLLGVRLRWVILHEIGHLLGLVDHSKDRSDIMCLQTTLLTHPRPCPDKIPLGSTNFTLSCTHDGFAMPQLARIQPANGEKR